MKTNSNKYEIDYNKSCLSIVIPCYKEEEVLEETTKRLSNLLDQMITANIISSDSFILYVNDGSTDQTWVIIEHLHSVNKYVHGVNLAGNVGHQRALLAGLNIAHPMSDFVISIDADLQDDIEVIPQMVQKYKAGYDIVYGVRKERKTDTWFKRTTALGFYKLMNIMGVQTVYNHADFRLMSKRAVEFLCQFPERNLFLRGIVPLIGYKTDCVYYNRAERFAGESKYPLSKMLNFAIDGITSFSVKPIRFCIFIGVLFCLIGILFGVCALYRFFIGATVDGWTSLFLTLWFIGGCIMIAIGIVGEYVGKIYIEAKARPRYNIEKII